jgi:cytochrome c5
MNNFLRLGLAAVLLAAVLLAASLAQAQSGGASAPDAGAGKKRAAVCFACHNADGISRIPGTPHLAGQERSYLESALRAYRDGTTRQNPTMNAMAKPLSDRDIANIAAYYSLQTRMNNGQTAADTLAALQRIRPVGNAVTEAPTSAGTAPAAPRDGRAVYRAACVACHDAGIAGAPKIGDKGAWSSRVAQGQATLVKHAMEGFKGMPAKGGCASCSDADIRAAVEYLSHQVQ